MPNYKLEEPSRPSVAKKWTKRAAVVFAFIVTAKLLIGFMLAKQFIDFG